jgi:hypothetical protein
MSEHTPPSTNPASRDALNLLWRALASQKTTTVLLVLSAIAVSIALLFSPQRPDPSANAAELTRWTSDAQQRFGRWYDVLSALGALNVGASLWLRALLACSALSLAVGLADRAAQVARLWRHPNVRQAESFFQATFGSGGWRVFQERAAVVETLAQRLVWPARLPWKRLRMYPLREEAAQVSYLHHDWLSRRRAAALLIHLGLLCILVGVALDARLGWRQEGVALMPGQAIQFARQPDFSLRLEDVQGAAIAGQAVSRIALDGPGGASLTGSVAVGRPYTARGVTVYQRDVGPILWVSARDAASSSASEAGAPIPLVDASVNQAPADEVRLAFTESRVEQYLSMPDIRKVVRLVLYRQGETWDPGRDELQIEVYAGDTLESSSRIVGDGLLELGGIAYELMWEQYAVLDVARSSWQWLVRAGMGLALLGLIATLLVPSARLWVRVVEEKEASVVELAGEMPGEAEWLATWLGNWRRRLQGSDADG